MPSAPTIEVTNTGSSTATFNLDVNGNLLFASNASVVADIENSPLFASDGAAVATWAWMMDNTYHWEPYTGDNWQHAPYLYLNSMGFGLCDDVAQIYAALLKMMGYDSRVQFIEGHVVSEVFDDGSWKIFDVDLRDVYIDHNSRLQGYEYVVSNSDDYAGNLDNSFFSYLTQSHDAFTQPVINLYKTTGDNQTLPPPVTPDFGGSVALALPSGASITIENAPDDFLLSMYDSVVPDLSLLKVSFGQLNNFDFQYPLVPVAISGSGTVVIDGQTYDIGSTQLNDRLANRSLPIYEIFVNSDAVNNQITYLLNSKRFSLSSTIGAQILDDDHGLSLAIKGTDSNDNLHGSQVLLGYGGDDSLTADGAQIDRAQGGLIDGGDGNDTLRVTAGADGIGIWSHSAFNLAGGAGDDRVILEGTQIRGDTDSRSLVDGGSGFDTLVWNGSYNLTFGGHQNPSLGLYDDTYVREIDTHNIEKIDLVGASVTGLAVSFTAADVEQITSGSDFDQSQLGLGLTGTGNVLFVDAGFNQVDLSGWTAIGRTSFQGLDYDVLGDGASYLALAVVSDRVLSGTSADDRLVGFVGNDIVSGGGGADTLIGGDGNDQITQTAASPNAAAGTAMLGGTGDDLITFEGIQAYTSSYVKIDGGAGQDVINAGLLSGQYVGSIQIDGGTGDDVITVGGIQGGTGGLGYIDGGDGNDSIEVRPTPDGVGIWGNVAFQIRGGAGDDRFVLGGTQVAISPASAGQLDGGVGFDTLVWNGSYNLTGGRAEQNPSVGLIGSGYAQDIQTRNIEKIDLVSTGVAGLDLKFTANDVAIITFGSDFQQSSLGMGLTGVGKTLFVEAGSNHVDIEGWVFVANIDRGGTDYKLFKSGSTYLALDDANNSILVERPATSGSTGIDTSSINLSYSGVDPNDTHSLSYDLTSSVWSGGTLSAATLSAVEHALSLADGAGSVTATLSIEDRLVDFLGAGETLTLTYNVTVADQAGGSATQPVTFTVSGANDAVGMAAGIPDLTIDDNLKTGARAGVTVAAIYAPGSDVNLLDGLPALITSNSYGVVHQADGTNGYNYLGGHGWFAANGINLGSIIGGEIVFADGTTGVINAASNGSGPSESAYVYYKAYEPGHAYLTEQGGATGSAAADKSVMTLSYRDIDLADAHSLSSGLVSSVWSGGTLSAATLTALEHSLSLGDAAGTVTATLSITDRAIDFLGAGETLTLTYNVTVKDQAGSSATQPVTFTITGTNDAPAMTAGIPDLTIDSNVKAGVGAGVTVAALYAPGSDVNLLAGLPALVTNTAYGSGTGNGYNYLGGHNWFVNNGISIGPLIGGKIVFADGTTGLINAASNGGAGESAYVYYKAYEPGHAYLAERDATSGSAAIDTSSIDLSYSDADLTDTHSLSSGLASSVWSGGTVSAATLAAVEHALSLTEDAGTITATLSIADRVVDFLGAGETLTLTYNVTVSDQAGGSATQPASFTFTGANDAVEMAAGIPDLTVDGNLKAAGAGSGVAVAALYAPGSDVNLLAGLPALITNTAYGVVYGSGTANGYNYLGGHNWFVANGISLGSLIGGQIVFADGTAGVINAASNGSSGSSESAYIYYKSYEPGHAYLTERAATSGSAAADTSVMTLSYSDIDLTDTHNLSSGLVSSIWSGGTLSDATLSAVQHALSLTDNAGTVAATLLIADQAVDFLGAGETLTLTYNVTVKDQAGSGATQPLTFTITGTNDAPVMTAGIAGAGLGVTVAALYAPGSGVNLLAGLPALVTNAPYDVVYNSGTSNGYSYLGGHDWFTTNGINLGSLLGGQVVFADGTTGLINFASDGNPGESAYLYYTAEPGHAYLMERAATTGSTATDIASIEFTYSDADLNDTHGLSYGLVSTAWSGGTLSAATLSEVEHALSLFDDAGTVTATLSIADRAVDFLGAGETLTLTYNVTVQDQAGGSATQALTFTINGAAEPSGGSSAMVADHALGAGSAAATTVVSTAAAQGDIFDFASGATIDGSTVGLFDFHNGGSLPDAGEGAATVTGGAWLVQGDNDIDQAAYRPIHADPVSNHALGFADIHFATLPSSELLPGVSGPAIETYPVPGIEDDPALIHLQHLMAGQFSQPGYDHIL